LKSPVKSSTGKTVLGIDPGSIVCGYGLVSAGERTSHYIGSGRIAPPSSKPLHYRLRCIYEGLTEVIRQYRPDDIVVEKIFFAKGVKSALSLGHARGVAILAAASEDVNLHEYSALEVKKAVVGYGRAEKRQVQDMVRIILNIKGPLYPDSADALALALCYLNTIKFMKLIGQS